MKVYLQTWFRSVITGLFSIGIMTATWSLLAAPTASAACTALPSGSGTATFTMNAPSNGTYRFWAHLYSPSSGKDAVYLQVDQSYCQITVGNAALPAGAFTWVDYQNGTTSNKINMTLTAGNHTVILAGLDAGVGVDKVLLLLDTNCVPTGDGTNCISSATPTPTPTGGSTPTPVPTVVVTPVSGSTPAPSGATPVSGTITLPKATAGTTRTYLLDGKPVPASSVDTTTLSNGEHTLEVVDKDASGKTTTTSQKLLVDNRKSWPAQVLDWIRQPLHAGLVALGIVVVAAGGAAAWWLLRRRRLGGLGSQLPPTNETPQSTAPQPTVIPAAPAIPGSQLIMPDSTEKSNLDKGF